MTQKLFQQKSPDTKYSARYVASFPINLTKEKIDLYKWVTEMTDANYVSYSKAHQAMGSFFKDGVFYMMNVENIGNETLVQHYELKFHAPGHIQFYSSHSKAYVMRWFPAKVGVPWEMQINATSATTSELTCIIGADFPTLFLKLAAWLNGLGGTFIHRHLMEEGKAFANDIEKKFGTV
jgi:hypothetical protein